MNTHRFGKFEVNSPGELVRTALGVTTLSALAWFSTTPESQTRIAALARNMLRLRETVRGLDNVSPNQAYVVTPLHEGFVDPLLLMRLRLPMRFVVRDELFDWPILGHLLARTRQVQVRPESRVTGLRRLVLEVSRAVSAGESVVMFPQGSLLGIEAAFQSGPFRLADSIGVPVLPVVITGTHRVWEHPFTDRLRFGQPVFIQVLEPIPAGHAVESMARVEAEMKKAALNAPVEPRRFRPERDGYWDGYRYEIDPSFSEIADLVATHRARLATGGRPQG